MTCRPEQAHHSPAVAPHWALVSTPPCAGLNGTLGHSELAGRRDQMCCYVLHDGPPLHRHVRPGWIRQGNKGYSNLFIRVIRVTSAFDPARVKAANPC